jgi:hypothetical protein
MSVPSGARIVTTLAAPSANRRSARGQVNPVGPHQARTSAGSLHAPHTAPGGVPMDLLTWKVPPGAVG